MKFTIRERERENRDDSRKELRACVCDVSKGLLIEENRFVVFKMWKWSFL